MNSSLREYLDSFRLTRQHLYSVLIDGFTLGVIWLAFSWFRQMLQERISALPEGILTPEQAQQLLATAPELLQNYALQVKSALLFFVGGGIFLVLFTLFFFSFSQWFFWNHLTDKKLLFRTYWKWNLLHLSSLLLFFVYLVFYVIVRLGFSAIISVLITNRQLYALIQNGVDALFALLFIAYFFLVQREFTKTGLVWRSLMGPFSHLNKNIFRLLVFSFLTLFLLSLLLLPFQNYFFLYPQRGLIAQGIVLLLFLAWMRVVVVRTVSYQEK